MLARNIDALIFLSLRFFYFGQREPSWKSHKNRTSIPHYEGSFGDIIARVCGYGDWIVVMGTELQIHYNLIRWSIRLKLTCLRGKNIDIGIDIEKKKQISRKYRIEWKSWYRPSLIAGNQCRLITVSNISNFSLPYTVTTGVNNSDDQI